MKISIYRLQKWLNFSEIGRENIIPQTKICSAHFEDKMFTNSVKNRLIWNAVPTVLNFDVLDG